MEYAEPKLEDLGDSQADQRRLLELFPAVVSVDFENGLAETLAWSGQCCP